MRTRCNNDVTIRRAEISDLRFIQHLSKKVFDHYGPYERILAEWFLSGKTVTRLALIEASPAGFAIVRPLEDHDPFHAQRIGELLAIAVEPKKQGLGLGNFLMIDVLRVAQALGLNALILCTAATNEPGKGLFKKHGFKALRVDKGYYPEGQEALMLVKTL
jgi:ribosomal protein S18 acetylase RimI-like enzyme